jgi:hypothetical protein
MCLTEKPSSDSPILPPGEDDGRTFGTGISQDRSGILWRATHERRGSVADRWAEC